MVGRNSLLIVEDERLLSACLRRHFSALGVEVTIAGSVAEGRGLLDRRSYDACLLDVGLPDGDGLSLLDTLPIARSIVITATPDQGRLDAAGVRHVVPKPIDLDVLTRTLSSLGFPGELDWTTASVRPETASTASAIEPGSTESRAGGEVAAESASFSAHRAGLGSGLRIMLYSHDTVGLGHFRRNLTIARSLSMLKPRPHVLMISGATEAMRFPKPDGVDVITLPALAKIDSLRYGARSLGVSLKELIAIRSQTILAAAASFVPDVLVVDNVPRGAERELDVTLAHLRTKTHARIVLGLRDVLDEPAAVARDWARQDNENAIARYFDAVWVYGDPAVVELGAEYAFSAETRAKLEYVGYLDRSQGTSKDGVGRARAARPSDEAYSVVRPYVLCLVGGGEDGYRLADAFSRIGHGGCKGRERILVLGPFMPESERADIHRLARSQRDLRVLDFVDDPTDLIAGADEVISMGGHNSISEILSFRKPALIVPRILPRREQWIRAHRLARLGVLDVCEPDDLCPARLGDWIEKGADRLTPDRAAVDMGGLERVRALLHAVAGRSPTPPEDLVS